MVFVRDINLIFWLLLASFTRVGFSCVAKPNGVKRVSPRHEFYLYQRVPDIDEFSEGASGKPLKPIRRNSEEYHRLSRLYNPGIIFHEGNYPESGDTRLMSKRCIDALNKLEKLVKQYKRWDKIKLRVMAAWDEETSHKHDSRSLHYEGRAVDITTSDGDRSKLGLLARMAVEAGFDWVRFHRHRVHASVRADGEDKKVTGCFRSNSTVHLEGGKTKTLDQLKIGDKIQSVTENGELIYSEVFMFIDNKPEEKNVLYFVLETEKPKRKLYLTKSHLVYVRRRFSSNWGVQFAKNVQEKDFVNVSSNGTLVTAEVTRISIAMHRGAVAPLTHEGNIIVDGVLASCYALLDDQRFVDTIFSPAKTLHKYFPALLNGNNVQQGVHWYARLLLFLNDYLSVLT